MRAGLHPGREFAVLEAVAAEITRSEAHRSRAGLDDPRDGLRGEGIQADGRQGRGAVRVPLRGRLDPPEDR